MSIPTGDAKPTQATDTSDSAAASANPNAHEAAARLADDAEGARLLAELGVSGEAGGASATTQQDEQADPEHITAHAFMKYFLELQGMTLDEARLPPLALATFQGRSFEELLDLITLDETDETTLAEPAEVAPDGSQPARRKKRHPFLPLELGRAGEKAVVVTRLRVGAPAAVTDLEELIALGVRDILVVGVAGSLQPALPIGSLVIPTGAIREEGTSFHYVPAGEDVAPDPTFTQALVDACAAINAPVATGPVWTTDAPYRELQSKVQAYGAAGALAVEMEASALFAAAAARGVRVGLIMAISDELFHPWRPGYHMNELFVGQRLASRAAVLAAQSLG